MDKGYVEKEIYQAYIKKLQGKFYGLLCEREKDREWIKFLDSLYVELNDFSFEHRTINYLSLMQKVASLRYLNYDSFRTTIFDCINLIQIVGDKNELL